MKKNFQKVLSRGLGAILIPETAHKRRQSQDFLSHCTSPFVDPQGHNPMTVEKFKRKLTAIFSADVKGYSRLMGTDEEATLRTCGNTMR
jgi:class 3 adenylate cyclase